MAVVVVVVVVVVVLRGLDMVRGGRRGEDGERKKMKK